MTSKIIDRMIDADYRSCCRHGPDRAQMTEFSSQLLLNTQTATIRDVVCRGECLQKSAEECAHATHLVFPYRGADRISLSRCSPQRSMAPGLSRCAALRVLNAAHFDWPTTAR